MKARWKAKNPVWFSKGRWTIDLQSKEEYAGKNKFGQ